MKIKFNKILLTMAFVILIYTCVQSSCFAESYSDGRLLKGFDGCRYSLSGYYNGYCYNSEGWLMSTLKHEELGENQLYHYVNDGDDKTIAYCLEHRVSANSTYLYLPTSISASNYMKFYPEDQREGILATAMYAPQYQGEKSPVSGTNTDDWYWAAQVIIWEFQEGIRRDVSEGIWDRHTGRFVDKNGTVFTGSSNRHYYNSLFYDDGTSKPAYKCYKWIINNLNSGNTIPSFAALASSNAKTYMMERDDDGTYFVELDDRYDLGVDFFTKSSGITVKRNGSKYIFLSDKPLENGKTILGRKVPEKAGEALIVWDAIGTHRQTLMTGTPSPKSMYIKLKGELPKGNILIHKSAEDGEVSGVRFKITGADEFYVTTDEKGDALIEDILCGTYTITELDVPVRYEEPKEVTVEVEHKLTEEVYINNRLKTIDLLIEKRDAYTDEPLENTVFVVVDKGVKSSASEEYVTDENGKVLVKDALKAGHDYQVKEIRPPEGYKLDEIDGIEFEPTGENEEEDVLFKNKPYLGFKLIKTTEEGMPLEGAEYTIYKEGVAVMSRITDSLGEIDIFDLEPGDYTIKETKAPIGRILDSKTEEFTISGENHDTYELRLINEEMKGSLTVRKTDSDTKEPIAGTIFKVYAAEDIINADGLKYEKDEAVCIIVTDYEGEASLNGLSLGEYYLKESKSSAGYVKTNESFKFEIADESNVQISVENEKTVNPKTGDGSNALMFLIVGVLCLCGAFMGLKFID